MMKAYNSIVSLMKSRCFNARRHHYAGFSLIELMISMVLGLVVMAAVLALFLNLTRSNTELSKMNQQIENGRFAIQILQSDLEHAGFWGKYTPPFNDISVVTPSGVPTALPDPCLAYSSWGSPYITNLLGIPAQGDITPPSGTGCVTNMATYQKINTDVLVVRHAELCLPGVGNCEADASGKLYFQPSLCESEISTAPYVLGTSGFTLHQGDCSSNPPGAIAEKRKFISNIYYIRSYASTVGDGIPTLMLSSFDLNGSKLAHQTEQPLIEGIEGFRVEYGIDNVGKNGLAVSYTGTINRGDGVPDVFVRCEPCTYDQLTNVVAVRVYVLARNQDITQGYTDTKKYYLGTPGSDKTTNETVLGPFNDGYKRHVYTSYIRLTNPSGRRDTTP